MTRCGTDRSLPLPPTVVLTDGALDCRDDRRNTSTAAVDGAGGWSTDGIVGRHDRDVAVVLVTQAVPAGAGAEDRFALVIGKADYQESSGWRRLSQASTTPRRWYSGSAPPASR